MKNNNLKIIYDNIKNNRIDFNDDNINNEKNLKDLLLNILVIDEEKRVNIQQIKNYSFFSGIN